MKTQMTSFAVPRDARGWQKDGRTMYAEEIAKLESARAELELALHLLLLKNRPHTLHLPIEDLKIALRFLQMTRKALEKAAENGAVVAVA